MGSNSVIRSAIWLAQLSPDAAILLLTAGLFFIYYEFNRPGTILVGAIGLLATLLGIAALTPRGFNPVGITLLLTAVALLMLDLLRPIPIPVSLAASVALIFGLRNLLAHACCTHISTHVAVACGLLLGPGTSVLTRIARRARVNKGLD